MVAEALTKIAPPAKARDVATRELRAAPRYDLEAERAVLGAVLLRPSEVLPLVASKLDEADFYHPAHAVIFRCMKSLDARSEPIDSVTLADELRRAERLNAIGGLQYLGSLEDTTPTSGKAEAHAAIVADLAAVRRLQVLGQSIVEAATSSGSTAEQIQSMASATLAKVCLVRSASATVSLEDEVLAMWAELEQPSDPVPPRSTGLRDLDEILGGGTQPEQLIVVAARPAMGKTSLVTQIGRCMAAAQGLPVLFFSLEMPRRELRLRLLCEAADVERSQLLGRTLDDDGWDRLNRAGAELARVPMFINDTKEISFADIRAIALQETARRGPLGAVIVDYVQLVKAARADDNRAQQIADITRGLKILAGVLKCPVFALSQLSRKVEERPNKRPLLADLRESGAIEQDADIVIFVYRDEVYNKGADNKGIAELIVAKQRNGPTNTARVRFRADRTSFFDLDESELAERESAQQTSYQRRTKRRRSNNATATEDQDDDR